MLRRTKLRRAVGAVLIVTGAVLMWLAPETAFSTPSGTGAALLIAGVVIELVGIALEHRDERRKSDL